MARPIRVTYVITDLKRGGVPLHLYRLATGLPTDQFDLQVISLAEVGPVGDMLTAAGIRVAACGARSWTDAAALLRLWRLCRQVRPQIIHALLFHANMAARLVGPLAGIVSSRIISEIQTVEIERRWHLLADNLTCRWCRFEAGNSVSVVDHLHRAAWIPRSRLRLMPGGVDVAAFADARPAHRAGLRVPEGSPLIIWTGRLDPIKGFEEMLAAFRCVRSEPAAHLLLVGEGAYRPVVERLVSEHRLSDRVHLLGERQDVPALLKAADVFLFCSRTEGLPNSLLEAMAAGLPIVATDAPGCRDVVRHGFNGLLAPVRDIPAIAGAVERLLADPPAAQTLGRNGHRWVTDHFSVKTLTLRWAEIYRMLVATPVGAGGVRV